MILPLLFILLALMGTAHAATPVAAPIEKIFIPGAKCGNGEPYAIYKRLGKDPRIVLYFNHGGACWDYISCFAPMPLRKADLFMPDDSALQRDLFLPSTGPIVSNASIFYFPYCTGDIYLGDHETYYQGLFGKKKVYHYGRRNIELARDFLLRKGHLNPMGIDQLILLGVSAGSLGLFLHLETFDEMAASIPDKVLIADSPGLHFSNKLGQIFPPRYTQDIKKAFMDAKWPVGGDPMHGNLAKTLDTYCENHADWRIGILQSDGDFVMSLIFGQISLKAHKEAIFGPEGINAALKRVKTQNCSAWIPSSYLHMFLPHNLPFSYNTDLSPHEFMNQVLRGDTESAIYTDVK